MFLINASCLAERQQISILSFGLTRPGLEPAGGEYACAEVLSQTFSRRDKNL